MWTLTHSVDGEKHVEIVDAAWVPLLAPLVEDGRGLENALSEVLSLNARLFRLWRQQEKAKPREKRTKLPVRKRRARMRVRRR